MRIMLRSLLAGCGCSALGRRLGERVEVLVRVVDQRLHFILRDMALGAEVTARRYVAAHRPITVEVMRRGDGDGLAFLDASPRVARHAAIGVAIDLIAVDLVRDRDRKSTRLNS